MRGRRQRLSGLGLAFALGACAASGDDDHAGREVLRPQPEVGWKPIKPKASCDPPNVWRVAKHFHLARDVDYIADVIGTNVISESGEPCASASDPAQCKMALETLPDDREMFAALGHHLVSIEGDSVRIWLPPSVLPLLGDVDTPAEAIWFAMTAGYNVDCDAAVFDTGHGGFGIAADRPDMSCASGRAGLDVQVNAKGEVAEGDPIRVEGSVCAESR